ncbi:hypothetical protein TSUD_271260 [Trifolium subterraneum]|uniref:Uncharacterized protein n=1 Tax=Trifolium subterraneum TaxID=3900 RepID=A0A2Z6MV51_TRISU|nr:hypothetical protein TSUD_271260 [Trifolium subterraneum]
MQQQQQFMMQMIQQNQQFINRAFWKFIKMMSPSFEGTTDPLVAQGWLKEWKRPLRLLHAQRKRKQLLLHIC